MTVIIGMDPHKRSATIEVIDEREGCAKLLWYKASVELISAFTLDGLEQFWSAGACLTALYCSQLH